jgi:IS5 family transposase
LDISKAEHRMDRNPLAHGAGHAINAVLAAGGYNFRLLIRWLALLCALIRLLLAPAHRPASAHQPA